jgi:hypothetical protein
MAFFLHEHCLRWSGICRIFSRSGYTGIQRKFAGRDAGFCVILHLSKDMQSTSTSRISRVSIAASIVLVLMAMMLPVCHLHPLLDKSAPDHCAICVSLHAALPMGAHLPLFNARLLSVGRVVLATIRNESSYTPLFAESRAPPLPA